MTTHRPPILHFCRANRTWALRQHRALMRGVREKILPAFDDAKMELEADAASDEAFERMISQPAPENFDGDLSDFAEAAIEEGVERYQSLEFVKGQLQALSVAGLYHLWERTLKEFVARELRKEGLDSGTARVHRADFRQLIDGLTAAGFEVRKEDFFDDLEAIRLVANVCKHGDGSSFRNLEQKAPELLLGPNEVRNKFSFGKPQPDDLWIDADKIEAFGSAIERFWKAMPERLSVPESWR